MGGEQSHPPPPTGIQIWHKYGQHDIKRYSFGDLIAFERTGYSHWGMYYKNGKIVHFNPSNCGEKVGPLNAGKWYDGAVTIESLASIAGIVTS
jgi:cell wall-associated NlpC family hydrolase